MTYDESDWPILVVSAPGFPLGEVELQQHLERVSSYFRRGQPFGIIVDVRGSPVPSADARRRIAERMDADNLRYPNLVRGTAVVVLSALHRGAVNVISWLASRPTPMEAFTTTEAAKSWLRKRLS